MEENKFNIISKKIFQCDICSIGRFFLYVLLFPFLFFLCFYWNKLNTLISSPNFYVLRELFLLIFSLFYSYFIFEQKDNKFVFLKKLFPNENFSFQLYEVEINNKDIETIDLNKCFYGYFIFKKYDDFHYLILEKKKIFLQLYAFLFQRMIRLAKIEMDI